MLYFPPLFKYVEEPKYAFSAAERQRAIQEYRKYGADTLFELIVDHDGKVKRARLLRTQVRREYHQEMIEHVRRMSFTQDAENQKYRAFFFPTRYRLNAEFEWVGLDHSPNRLANSFGMQKWVTLIAGFCG